MGNRILASIFPVLAAASLFAQSVPKYSQNVITTVAGRDWIFPPQGGPAINAPLGNVTSLALDSAGLLYIADPQNNVIFRVDAAGNISTFAGNGIQGFSGEGGPAANASLSLPTGIAFDTAGNFYISDQGNQRIRKITTDGTIRTIAGTGQSGYNGDNKPALQATLLNPGEIQVDANGNIYFVDGGNNRIRMINPAGIISTVAGDGTPATLNNPKSFAFDAQGNLYISDYGNSLIKKLSGGALNIYAGRVGLPGNFGDNGPATSAKINSPWGLSFDSQGNLVFADSGNNTIRSISPAGVIATIAGTGTPQFAGDGTPAQSASFFVPAGVLISPGGKTYIADRGNQRVRQFIGAGAVSTLAGNNQYRVVASNAAPTQTFLYGPQGIAIGAKAHDLLIAESRGNAIRTVSPGGQVIKQAGLSLVGGYTPDRLTGANTLLNTPYGVAEGFDGTIYYADTNNNVVRAISPVDATIKTIAGVFGNAGYNGDNQPGAAAFLNQPRAVVADIAGNVYIADTGNNRIRIIDATTGTITTYAGNGTAGFSGDGSAAASAMINAPYSMAFSGNSLYFADQGNHRIRQINPTHTITTVAGSGSAAAPNGENIPALTANIATPFGLAFDSVGNMFFSDYQYHVVREVTTQGNVFTIAGNLRPGFAGDGGLASASLLNSPAGVAIDPNSGYLYIADSGNDRVRAIVPVQPVLAVAPTPVSLTASGGLTNNPSSIVNLTALLNQNGVLGAGSAAVTGLAYTITAADPWVVVSPASGTLPQSLLISANAAGLSAGPANSTITITAPGANPPSITIPVTVNVGPVLSAHLTANTSQLSLSVVAGAQPFSSSISLGNTGGGSINFNATQATVSGGNWLSLANNTGSFSNAAPYSLGVNVDPSQLAAGVYRGSVTVSGSSASGPITPVTIPVALTVSASTQVIQLSQTAMNFRAVTTGSQPLPQSFGIQNSGQGSMTWMATVVDANGSPVPWATLSASSGTVLSNSSGSSVDVTVSPMNMTAGDYYAKVLVSSSAANSPQTVSIVMTVLTASTATFADVQPSALVFTGAAGTIPSSQVVRIAAIGALRAAGISYTATGVTLDGAAWFTDVPRSNTILINSPDRIVVQPDFSLLQPGTYTGNLSLLFADGSTRTIKILSVVTASTSSQGLRPAAACSSSLLRVQFSPPLLQGSNSFTAYSGQQNTLAAKVVFDCSGANFTGTNGLVNAFFKDGEAAQPLTYNSAAGSWATAWSPPGTATGTVSVQLIATGVQGANPVAGSSETFVATLAPGARVPLVAAGGVVSAASSQADVPIGVGGLITIYGAQMVDGSAGQAASVPLPNALNGTQVLLENQPVPMLYASGTQINIQVPYETNVNLPQHLVVQRNGAVSGAFSIQVAAVQPAIFLQTAAGQGAIVNAANNVVADSSHPVHANDVITIYCTGLGPTNPAVATGAAATVASYITTQGITATIGGQNATLLYAGLTPGFPGLYQINAVVPAGVTGNTVPVIVTLAGQISPAATIAVSQ